MLKRTVSSSGAFNAFAAGVCFIAALDTANRSTSLALINLLCFVVNALIVRDEIEEAKQ